MEPRTKNRWRMGRLARHQVAPREELSKGRGRNDEGVSGGSLDGERDSDHLAGGVEDRAALVARLNGCGGANDPAGLAELAAVDHVDDHACGQL
jgi:hypothetical protein